MNLIGTGQRVSEVPVKVKYDPSRKSRVVGNIFSYAVRVNGIMLRTIRDLRPLGFFGIVCHVSETFPQ
jgi:hypothetical protein